MKWNKPNVPHKGWVLVDVIDAFEENGEYEHCMMCNTEMRFVHIVSHSSLKDIFRVGCTCAEKMTDDYVNPKLSEKKLKDKLDFIKRVKSKFDKCEWQIIQSSHRRLTFFGYKLFIWKSENNTYKGKINDLWGKIEFDNINDCKKALLDSVIILLKKQ